VSYSFLPLLVQTSWLADLSELGDVIVERHAVCCAANLMETLELNGRLVEERGVAPLVALASNQDANSRGEACRCLANLTLNPDVHQVRRCLV